MFISMASCSSAVGPARWTAATTITSRRAAATTRRHRPAPARSPGPANPAKGVPRLRPASAPNADDRVRQGERQRGSVQEQSTNARQHRRQPAPAHEQERRDGACQRRKRQTVDSRDGERHGAAGNFDGPQAVVQSDGTAENGSHGSAAPAVRGNENASVRGDGNLPSPLSARTSENTAHGAPDKSLDPGRSCLKQARVIAMLQLPAGATIAAMKASA